MCENCEERIICHFVKRTSQNVIYFVAHNISWQGYTEHGYLFYVILNVRIQLYEKYDIYRNITSTKIDTLETYYHDYRIKHIHLSRFH